MKCIRFYIILTFLMWVTSRMWVRRGEKGKKMSLSVQVCELYGVAMSTKSWMANWCLWVQKKHPFKWDKREREKKDDIKAVKRSHVIYISVFSFQWLLYQSKSQVKSYWMMQVMLYWTNISSLVRRVVASCSTLPLLQLQQVHALS